MRQGRQGTVLCLLWIIRIISMLPYCPHNTASKSYTFQPIGYPVIRYSNYIDTEEMILRKGAIAAHKGEKILIPINMRDGSVIAIGKGNPKWNYSAPHGAGRIMSRAKAKSFIDLEAYRKAMERIYFTSVNEHTLDEAPMAYKSLEDIVDVIGEPADIIEIMKPVYNFKASEDEPYWKKH